MKLLLVHQYFNEEIYSGGARFNEMTKFWAEKGHEITVLAGMAPGFDSKILPEYKGKLFVHKKQEKVNIWRCFSYGSHNTSFRSRLINYFSFVFSSTWAGIFKAGSGFDLILVTSPPLFLGITAYILSRIKRIPYVFEVRDLWPESAIDTGVVKNKVIIALAYKFEKFIYSKSKLINVLTPAFKDTLISFKNVPESKVICISNAADFRLSDRDLDDFNIVEFRKDKGLDNSFVIVYVGAHGMANHLIQLLDTAEMLRETKALFILIGDGMQKPLLIEEVQKRGLKNIRFVDPIPLSEALKYIIASDIGTSVLKRADIFKTIYSNKTFDYMACKKPILLLIDGVSRELIEKANCGIFAEPERPDDIAAKIRYCIEHPDELKTMGENGYLYAKEHFDRNKLADKYLEYLIRIAK